MCFILGAEVQSATVADFGAYTFFVGLRGKIKVTSISKPDETRARGIERIFQRAGHPESRALIVDSKNQAIYDSGNSSLPIQLTGVTKLFTLALVLRDIDRGAFNLETRISDILPSELISGLCVVDGQDHSSRVTIEHLLSHRSGIPDFMAPISSKDRPLIRQILDQDRGWSLDQALEISRHYSGVFVPGHKSRASFSSTNFLLLGAVLRDITGMTYDELIRLRVIGSLGLKGTYVFRPEHYEKYFTYAPVSLESEVIRVPKALASSEADGSIISTPRDTVRFFSALWRGELFDEKWIPKIFQDSLKAKKMCRIGLGVMVAPRQKKSPSVVGHAGISGTAVGVDPKNRNVAFMSTCSWTPLRESFETLGKLLQEVK